MPTYGGDEVNALVIDVGSTWTRAGFAGEDMPKAYFPSRVGYIESEVEISETVDEPKQNGATASSDNDVDMEEGTETNGNKPSPEATGESAEKRKQKTRKYFVGDTESATWRAGMEVDGPMEQGLVKDWDMYEKIWEYAFKSRMRVRPEEHPVMVSEAAWNTSALRAKLIEMAFEKFNCPAFYVCKNPVLAAFGTGRHTGLVVDVGGENTSACAVYEGFCLTKTICKQEIGGDFISSQILDKFKNDYSYEPTPIFDIKAKAPVDIMKKPVITHYNREGTTDSYLQEMRLRVMQEFKETTCEVIERPYESNYVDIKPTKPFEFPDGFNLSVGPMRYGLPEILFNPNQFTINRPKRLENTSLLGVHEIALKSVMASDVDLRPQLLNSVVIAGGSTLFPGFNDRFSVSMQSACPGSRMKLYAPSSNAERKVTAWLGGSVLASLGTFHQLWISRAEYDEHGASIVDKKCQ
ncbi:NuA4 histone acetyltransferase subunit [Coemansia sp. RSA 1813]|nr:NuA4 histone acetyltransferase subunit [Coemansia sp. RSA 1646]KAJ1770530.1 NuA4 histone acetyltransferase subunit [Coemansia sp. RSA 1843]KAJ2092932.1 NuA4 histone acetyltransferase subunit [Coemansia sp. RSA 986]KAJ2216253.1 NuA4 histone acetyltransferase subunit [Coemansia sp. RSA 487]KAJ2570574.1 NuA4 histone acetyltransferase subunit [Coemansia sp. RSA 1813]